ncbi:hypothetical protein [Saccharococcus caldoxylosilyticus]|uniref:Uncharacterized protein n=1 Tax=Parageobacillus caldoxylosilyticus NBRC 107762 TaxID=1220594 RepID=A0A023DGA8_9BACL|nr:hypothetical protein [Parageobacillus caldoxylosilyticus]MBB3853519.1 hypothetical protein [Parageobacillus caldoxylosilyticus]GAJ40305.1 hypothetical protein GCA01S_037_00140 [Parageobacillus caldoxylosilyticus NBRC 107762]
MSVMLIGQETFERVGKFLKAWKGESDEVIFARLVKWESLNRQNFERRYSEPVNFPEMQIRSINISLQPLISPEQMLKSLQFIHYQCCDYADEIDPVTLKEIETFIKEIQKDFTINQTFLEFCSWG